MSCGVLAALALAEIGLRLWSPGLPFAVQWGVHEGIEERAHQASREVYGTLTFDESGLRIGSGLAHDLTVLFIGDSFTEGHGVSDDQTFARATERALRRDGLMVRSLNAGTRGFGAAQELRVLRRLLDQFPVDAIVLQLFPMNDLSDNLVHGGFGIEGGRLIEYDAPRPPLRAVVTSTLAESWLQNLYVVRTIANAMAPNDAAPYDSPTSFELQRALLSEIVSTARGRGIAIVMLVIPTKLVQAVQRGAQSPTATQLGELKRFERVRELVNGIGLPWIDAGAVITDLEADAAKGDGSHFSPAGCAVIGDAIARTLEPLLRSRARAGSGSEPLNAVRE